MLSDMIRSRGSLFFSTDIKSGTQPTTGKPCNQIRPTPCISLYESLNVGRHAAYYDEQNLLVVPGQANNASIHATLHAH